MKDIACLPLAGKQKIYSLNEAAEVQSKLLKHLLRRAKFTAFGEHYRFSELLNSKKHEEDFKKTVPVHAYRDMYIRWWYRLLNGETYVTWPGKQKYFLTKGNDNQLTGKYIPVSRAIIRSYCIAGKHYLSSLPYKPSEEYDKDLLKLSYNKTWFGGTLAGIIAHHKPLKFHCCFRDLFCSNSIKKDSGYFLTEAGWVGFGIEKEQHEFRLIINNGLYYEFIPFDKESFDNKTVLGKPEAALSIEEIMEEEKYLLLITNNAGAWRYLTGYVVEFTDKEHLRFRVTDKVKLES